MIRSLYLFLGAIVLILFAKLNNTTKETPSVPTSVLVSLGLGVFLPAPLLWVVVVGAYRNIRNRTPVIMGVVRDFHFPR